MQAEPVLMVVVVGLPGPVQVPWEVLRAPESSAFQLLLCGFWLVLVSQPEPLGAARAL